MLPFSDGGWLLLGALLTDGSRYALLEQFFRQVVVARVQSGSINDAIPSTLDASGPVEHIPHVSTTSMETGKKRLPLHCFPSGL